MLSSYQVRISGHGGRPKLGFCLKKFWVFARYLHVYEEKRGEFASISKVKKPFITKTYNYPGADPFAPIKSCLDWNKLTIDEVGTAECLLCMLETCYDVKGDTHTHNTCRKHF